MEKRIDQLAGAHQLEYLNYRLSINKSKNEKKRVKVWWHGRWRMRLEHFRIDVPVPLSYFTVGQLFYILQIVSENYLADTHLIAFNKEKFLVKVLIDENIVESEEVLQRAYRSNR